MNTPPAGPGLGSLQDNAIIGILSESCTYWVSQKRGSYKMKEQEDLSMSGSGFQDEKAKIGILITGIPTGVFLAAFTILINALYQSAAGLPGIPCPIENRDSQSHGRAARFSILQE
jgi:hypothetical protein